MSPIFGCFFVVNHQETEVMHKKGGMYTTCSPRSKIVHIYQKTFFANFTRFLQNNEMTRIMMLYIIFVIFAKMTVFFRGGYTGKYGLFFTNFNLFFQCLSPTNRGNVQKCGGVPRLFTKDAKCPTLSENFFGNVAHLI